MRQYNTKIKTADSLITKISKKSTSFLVSQYHNIKNDVNGNNSKVYFCKYGENSQDRSYLLVLIVNCITHFTTLQYQQKYQKNCQ